VAALACAGGDAALAAELFAALVAELPAELASLRAAHTAADWVSLAEQAHRVRGATRYCGVLALDVAAEALERAARGGDAEQIARAFAEVQTEVHRLQQAAA
jgi:two-component system sensor histidine kinase BarA